MEPPRKILKCTKKRFWSQNLAENIRLVVSKGTEIRSFSSYRQYLRRYGPLKVAHIDDFDTLLFHQTHYFIFPRLIISPHPSQLHYFAPFMHYFPPHTLFFPLRHYFSPIRHYFSPSHYFSPTGILFLLGNVDK